MTTNSLAGQTYRKGSGRDRVLSDPADLPIKSGEDSQIMDDDTSEPDDSEEE